jgi:rare lipoprotein A
MMRGRHAALGASALLLVALQWGCASNGPVAKPSAAPQTAMTPDALTSPPRSDRGNPPFYDVLGKRYYVLPSSAGYQARGVASWYGRDFHGLATSSGETYNMHALTAAHTTLPIPTWVEVTNLANGKRVVVKVNDRGPFVDNRLIDLSYAAALQLDMIRNGTARVEVRALDAPPGTRPVTTTATTTATATPARDLGIVPEGDVLSPSIAVGGASAASPPSGASSLAEPLFVQVGAFAERVNAARLVDRLRLNGFVNAFVVTDDGRRALHRVRIGPLHGASEFDDVRARLRSLGFGESQLVTAR